MDTDAGKSYVCSVIHGTFLYYCGEEEEEEEGYQCYVQDQEDEHHE